LCEELSGFSVLKASGFFLLERLRAVGFMVSVRGGRLWFVLLVLLGAGVRRACPAGEARLEELWQDSSQSVWHMRLSPNQSSVVGA
jgi:hypothetical protein